MPSTCPEKRFGNKIWEKLWFHNFFRTLDEKVFFQRKFHVIFVKNGFYESIGKFWDFLKKREHGHSELTDYGENQHTEGKILLS